jgi:hypothetical protein
MIKFFLKNDLLQVYVNPPEKLIIEGEILNDVSRATISNSDRAAGAISTAC